MATYYVDNVNGSDSNNGSIMSPWATINHGLNVMAGGDTLYIRAGTYSEQLYLNIPSGTSWPAGATVVAGYPGDSMPILNDSQSGSNIQLSSQSNIIIDGLILDGTNKAQSEVSVLGMQDMTNCTFRNLVVQNAPASGIFAAQLVNILFYNVTVHDVGLNNPGGSGLPPAGGHGFYLSATGYNDNYSVTVDKCTIYNAQGAINSYGIQQYRNGSPNPPYMHNHTIRNTVIHDCANGMVIGSIRDSMVYNCVFYNNGNGAVGSTGVPGINVAYNTSTNIQLYNNTIFNCGGYGIGNDGNGTASGTIIENNILWNNQHSDAISPSLLSMTNTVASHNLQNQNPSFVNSGSGNFHLQPGSVAAGFALNLSNIFTTDLDGSMRPSVGAWAAGAFEIAGWATDLITMGDSASNVNLRSFVNVSE